MLGDRVHLGQPTEYRAKFFYRRPELGFTIILSIEIVACLLFLRSYTRVVGIGSANQMAGAILG